MRRNDNTSSISLTSEERRARGRVASQAGRPRRLDRVIRAGLVRAAVAKIALTQIGRATPREICHAHHLDDHHWVHRWRDREVRHARRQRTVRIHSHDNSRDSRSFFSHLSRPSDRLVSRGRRRRPDRSSGRSDNYLGDLGIHCWPPPPLSLANPISGIELLTDLDSEGSIVVALGTRKVRLRREPAVRRVFVDCVGEFAG
jgi:hypothetical protein